MQVLQVSPSVASMHSFTSTACILQVPKPSLLRSLDKVLEASGWTM